MLVISPHVVGSVYRSCTKSLLPHFVLILTRRSEIEDKEVSESVLKRISAGETEITSRKVRDNAAVGVTFNCVRGIAAEACLIMYLLLAQNVGAPVTKRRSQPRVSASAARGSPAAAAASSTHLQSIIG